MRKKAKLFLGFTAYSSHVTRFRTMLEFLRWRDYWKATIIEIK